jgi:hypothetical protein
MIVFKVFLILFFTFSGNSLAENNSWDFDEDGNADALTDGLLLLRYTFGQRDEDLVKGATAEASTLTIEQVQKNVAASTSSFADIDDNGSVDALSDGLLLLRYLFGLRGDTLTSSVVANDAGRVSPTDIEAYIESFVTEESSGSGLPENELGDSRRKVGLQFDSIGIDFEQTYAQMKLSNLSYASRLRTDLVKYAAKLSNVISSFFLPNALAQTSQLRSIDSSEAFEISKLFIDSELQDIDSTVTFIELDENGHPVLDDNGYPKEASIDCDLSTIELHVIDVRRLNLQDGSLIAEVLLPVELDQDCKAKFSQRTIIIDGQKTVFDITEDFQLESVVSLVPAKDPTFNISNEALIDFGDGIIRTLNFQDNILAIEQLSASTVDIRTDRLGRFIYDGTTLTGILDDTGSLALISFNKGSTAFEIFRPDPNESGYQNMAYLAFGSESEKLLITTGRVRYLDLENNTTDNLSLDINRPDSCHSDESSPECLFADSLNPGQVFLGRHQNWLIDTEAALNYKTGEYTGQLGCLPQVALACGNAGMFFDYVGNLIYVVDDSRVKFIRFNIETRDYSLINLDEWGYLAGFDYYITPENAYLSVVNSTNSNIEFIEINYDSETVTSLGVITEGSRVVHKFFSPNG